MAPLFSIITVTLNNLAGLTRTAQSLQPQTGDFEWVVIDGGSADGTAAWLEKTQARWLSEPDGGIYDAMNKAIVRAQGDYLLFLNAGDRLAAPDTLGRLAEEIKAASNPDFIYGDSCEERNGASPVYKKARRHTRIACGMFTHHQAMLYRRQALGDLRYDTAYRIAADYKFTVQFLRNAGETLYCPFPFCLFEPGGISQRQVVQGRREQFAIRRREKFAAPIRNIAIYAAQSATMGLRQLSPSLYWRLRQGR